MVLVYVQICAPILQSILEHFHHLHKKPRVRELQPKPSCLSLSPDSCLSLHHLL